MAHLPPEPDYEILKNDFMKIYENYDVFKENINRKNIDISNTAENYIQFCEDILSKIDENLRSFLILSLYNFFH